MNYFNETLKNLEHLREDLILLNEIYDDAFKPWIAVEVKYTDEHLKVNDAINQTTDLNLLYKLEKVLIKASHVKEITDKSSNENAKQKTFPNIKTMDKMKNNNKKNVNSNNSNQKTEMNIKTPGSHQTKPKFIAAHKTAPFKTDPSLHQKKLKIDPKKRSISAQPFRQKLKTISPIIISQNQDIDVKLETVLDVPLDRGQETANVEHILSQLRVDIERLKEIPQQEEPNKSPIYEMRTIFQSNNSLGSKGEGMLIPVELRGELRAYSRATSQLASIYLHRKRRESAANNNILAKCSNMQDIAGQIHRIRLTRTVLEHIVDLVKMFDFASLNISQVGFLQGCLSWILNEYLDTRSNSSEMESLQPRSQEISQSNEIRKWLDGKSKSAETTKEMFNFSIQAAALLSSPFVRLMETKRNNPISLTVPFSSVPQLKFTTEGRPMIRQNPYLNISTQVLIAQQSLQLSLTVLIGKWIREFKEKNKDGQNLSSSFRQIYGLFLSKYPVILKETP